MKIRIIDETAENFAKRAFYLAWRGSVTALCKLNRGGGRTNECYGKSRRTRK